MGLNYQYQRGQTPLDEEEKEGLLLPTLSTRGELDEFEQAKIEKALEWSLNNRFSKDTVLSITFIRELHQKMFSDLWSWAGFFRKTNKNIGVDKFLIEQELHKLTEDCSYWLKEKTFPEDEIAVRYKYGIVSIHPFPNGNGRHSRLCADILISHVFNRPVFTWGGMPVTGEGDSRRKYLDALIRADQGDMSPLVEFARSGI